MISTLGQSLRSLLNLLMQWDFQKQNPGRLWGSVGDRVPASGSNRLLALSTPELVTLDFEVLELLLHCLIYPLALLQGFVPRHPDVFFHVLLGH